MENIKRLEEIHNTVEKLKAMGLTDEQIKMLWQIGLETANKIIKEA